MSVDAHGDVVALTEALVDIESVSGNEAQIADRVEQVLTAAPYLEVTRIGHSIAARTRLGRAERVVIAGHLDTVPVNDNLPSRNDGELLHGLGSCDMKGGVAVALHLAVTVPEPTRDITYVFYECEEVEAVRNGLRVIASERPDLIEADFAILMEPSNAIVEAGCQGTLRVEVTVPGQRAHSARAWRGINAIHSAAQVLLRLGEYEPRRPVVDGLEYHEGLSAVMIRGGVATNVIPDECVITVNHRFAPDRTEAEALEHVRAFFEGYEVVLTDSAPGARPGLDRPAAQDFVAAVGGKVAPKYGWTDVARFAALDVPAVNYGPGDPMVAHSKEEHVPIRQIRECETALRRWLTTPIGGDDE